MKLLNSMTDLASDKGLLYVEKTLFYSLVIFAGLMLSMAVALVIPEFYGGVLFGVKDKAYPFSFQMIMWVPFYVGLSDLIIKMYVHQKRKKLFDEDILKGSAATIYTSKNLVEVIRQVKSYGNFEEIVFLDLIHEVVLKYQTSRSVNECSSVLESLVNIYEKRLDLFYTKIRYISWLIPTMGFIGTVYGISLSVALVGKASPDDPTLLPSIAASLAIAFDTTLLALVQASILLFISNIIENLEFTLISDSNKYIYKKLINRLEPNG